MDCSPLGSWECLRVFGQQLLETRVLGFWIHNRIEKTFDAAVERDTPTYPPFGCADLTSATEDGFEPSSEGISHCPNSRGFQWAWSLLLLCAHRGERSPLRDNGFGSPYEHHLDTDVMVERHSPQSRVRFVIENDVD
jgi:hypothetical protein